MRKNYSNVNKAYPTSHKKSRTLCSSLQAAFKGPYFFRWFAQKSLKCPNCIEFDNSNYELIKWPYHWLGWVRRDKRRLRDQCPLREGPVRTPGSRPTSRRSFACIDCGGARCRCRRRTCRSPAESWKVKISVEHFRFTQKPFYMSYFLNYKYQDCNSLRYLQFQFIK